MNLIIIILDVTAIFTHSIWMWTHFELRYHSKQMCAFWNDFFLLSCCSLRYFAENWSWPKQNKCVISSPTKRIFCWQSEKITSHSFSLKFISYTTWKKYIYLLFELVLFAIEFNEAMNIKLLLNKFSGHFFRLLALFSSAWCHSLPYFHPFVICFALSKTNW